MGLFFVQSSDHVKDLLSAESSVGSVRGGDELFAADGSGTLSDSLDTVQYSMRQSGTLRSRRACGSVIFAAWSVHKRRHEVQLRHHLGDSLKVKQILVERSPSCESYHDLRSFAERDKGDPIIASLRCPAPVTD